MSDPIQWPFGAQDPICDDTYNAAVEKGTKLLEMLTSNDRDAGQLMNPARPTAQSDFTSRQALANHNYTTVSVESNLDKKAMRSLKAAFEGIGANAELVRDGGTNHVVEHCHSHGLKHLKTAASFQQICNPAQGVLIAYANDSPSSIAHSNSLFTVPSLRYWSDVAYLQWLEACGKSSSESHFATYDPAPIRFVFRLRILNSITSAVA